MKAVVVGGATIDVITSINSHDIEQITMHNATNSFLLLEQGKKVEASHIDSHVGGGASNAAVSMSRLGAEVSAILRLGNDVEGDKILARLAAENIDTSNVGREEDMATGKSIVICAHEHNAGVFVHRGANTQLRPEYITPDLFEGADLVYVSTLSSASADAFPKIVELAKQAGAFVACNPGIRQLRNRSAQVLEACKWIDLIAINKDEARTLAKGLGHKVDIKHTVLEKDNPLPKLLTQGFGERGFDVPVVDFFQAMHAQGPSHVVITNGSDGGYMSTGGNILYRPALPCEVATTLGAGDAFNSTLAMALVNKQTVFSAMNMAAQNSASVASVMDTQSGLMDKDTMQKRLLAMDAMRVQVFPVHAVEV